MPLGAARLNTLAKVLGSAFGPRTSDSMTVELFGNTQISTAQNQFGGSSIAMDGSGDYMRIQDTGNNLDFGTGDFTVEWWQYLTSLDRFAIDFRAGSSSTDKILLYSYPSDGSADDLYLWTTANRISAFNCLSANQWQHIALVRESSNTRLYVDGTQFGGTYSDSNNYQHSEVRIWHNSIGAENYTPPGYVDEFRISKGFARYSGSSFTVPTSAFTADEHTHLLIHGDGSNGSTNITDDPAPYRPTWLDTNDSYYLNGTVSSNSTSSVDMTVAFWFRHVSGMASDAAPIILYAADSGVSNFTGIEYQGGRLRVVTQSSGVLNDFLIGTYSASYGSGTYDDGDWHHFLFSRDGSASAKHAYVDGNSVTINVNAGRDNGSANMWLGSSMQNISIMSEHGFDTGGNRISDLHVTQIFVDNTFIDISQPSNREKFYNNGPVDMGSDGTSTGLDQPLIFHTGDTSTFATRGGDVTSFPYTVTANGTGIDGASSDGPPKV